MYSLEFERIGKRLFAEHLVGGNFGNISIKKGNDGFFIKPTGAYLNVATELVFVPLEGDVPETASTEYRVHREVYLKTNHTAIVHAHPPFAVAASLVMDTILPEDSEGVMFCPKFLLSMVHRSQEDTYCCKRPVAFEYRNCTGTCYFYGGKNS